jgi:hypothetical protein
LFSSLGWNEFVHERRGRGDTGDLDIEHPAVHLLSHIGKKGVPVVFTTPPWDNQRIYAAATRGPHKSAYEYQDFLRTEMVDMILRRQWIVLPYDLIKDLPGLRLSPIGVVPQRDRRPRTIVDYTFYGVNADTCRLAPEEAMRFGRAFQRLLEDIVNADPRFGPIYLCKVDISDGFYRVWLRADDIPKLGVSFPAESDGEHLVAFPLVLPMGWVSSPPYFCAHTETVADVTNERIMRGERPPPHRLDRLADTMPPPEEVPTRHHDLQATPTPPVTDSQLPHRRPLGRFEVYIDDFCGVVQGGAKRRRRVRRILFDTLDRVFRPLEPGDHSYRAEPASTKKLLKGDGAWATRKHILGWLVDTVASTLELPPHRRVRLHELLNEIPPTQKRLSVAKWHRILGELRSMTLAIPGARGLFSHIQAALRSVDTTKRIRASRHVHATLDDFRWLASTLDDRPTRLQELVATAPSAYGTTDAAGLGMGGILLPPRNLPHRTVATAGHPLVWRSRFPPDVVRDLVTFENPRGHTTNSDLELAATVVQHDVIAAHYDVRERTIHTATDNTPTLFWHRRGSISTNTTPAYLLRLQALHQRFHRYVPTHSYLPGPLNCMGDDASRRWDLSDDDLLTHFNLSYPQPTPWQLYRPNTEMLSAVTSALRRKRLPPESFLIVPPPLADSGAVGRTSVERSHWILPSRRSPIQSPSCKSTHTDTAPASLPPVVTLSALEQWRTPFAPLAKRSRRWGPRTSASTPTANSTSDYVANSQVTNGRIRPRTA